MKSSLNKREQAAVAALERRHRNESVHTRHVTRLALQLFDATRAPFDLTEADRRILEAAARLHDIGYCQAPLDHVRASAQIARRALAGLFTASERRELAALIRLHSGRDFRTALDAADFPLRPAPPRVLKLGALLRVADGLDNGHVQDARIVEVRPRRRAVELRVHAPHWPRGVKTARRKADLWTVALGAPLEVKRVRRPRAKPLVSPRLARPEALRRLLSLAYRKAVAETEGALAGDVEALHELRIALRRCRVLLRALSPRSAAAALRGADARLAATTAALGAARDLDIGLKQLPARSPWRKPLKELRAREQAQVQTALTGSAWDALRGAMGRLLRIELPHSEDTRPARAAIRRALRKAAHRADERLRTVGDGDAAGHALRTALRRVVHLAEIDPRLVKRNQGRRAAALHSAVRALGAWRDQSQLTARLEQLGAGPATVHTMRRRTDKSWKEAQAALGKHTRRALCRLG